MMKNPLPNNRNPKSQRAINAAEVKNLFLGINVEEDGLFLIFFIVII